MNPVNLMLIVGFVLIVAGILWFFMVYLRNPDLVNTADVGARAGGIDLPKWLDSLLMVLKWVWSKPELKPYLPGVIMLILGLFIMGIAGLVLVAQAGASGSPDPSPSPSPSTAPPSQGPSPSDS